MTRHTLKHTLKKRGYTVKGAARVLGISHRHLCYILAGVRQSKAQERAIQSLPSMPRSS